MSLGGSHCSCFAGIRLGTQAGKFPQLFTIPSEQFAYRKANSKDNVEEKHGRIAADIGTYSVMQCRK